MTSRSYAGCRLAANNLAKSAEADRGDTRPDGWWYPKTSTVLRTERPLVVTRQRTDFEPETDGAGGPVSA